MRKFFLLGILLLSNCVAAKASAPTSMPEITNTLEPTLTAIPKATLIPEEARKLVQELLENNGRCELPCWWGIIPGKTTWAEARSFLESFSVYIGETGLVRVPLPSPYSNATYMDHGYSIKNGIVDIIHIYNYNLAPNYYLPKFLEIYGQPSEIWIQTFSQEEIGQQNFTFDLFYGDKGILVEYGTADPIGDVGGKLQTCLIGLDSPFMYLWSPEKNKMSFQDAKQRFIDTINMPEPMPLFEATGMDVKTFYETFKNPDTDICLETPKNLWP